MFSRIGALLFVGSLVAGAVAYLRYFDAVAPAGAPLLPALAIDVLLFSVFAMHHSVLARTSLKQWVQARVGPQGERTLYVVAASLLFLLCVLAWRPLPGIWYALSGVWWWMGVAVQVAGLVVTLQAARTLSIRTLMGLEAPPAIAAAMAAPPAVETRGLYGIVRHPIYLGWLLLVGGAPFMTSTRLLFAVVSIAYLVVAIPFEERSLIELFGDPYRSYQRQVRWRMVPGVY